MVILSFGDSLKNFEYNERKEESERKVVTVTRLKETDTTTTTTVATSTTDPSRPLSSPSKNKRRQINLDDIKDKRLVPLLRADLKCVFVGFNPGTESALQGHYYAHRSNLFWKLLYESGCVSRPVTFKDDTLMPDEFCIGFTDLVARPTPGIKQLSGQEMVDGVPILEQKISTHQPKIVCLVGKGIWESVYRYKRGKRLSANFEWGLQTDKLGGCQVYVVPSTSGLAASISRETKLRVWQALAAIINGPRDSERSEEQRVRAEPGRRRQIQGKTQDR